MHIFHTFPLFIPQIHLFTRFIKGANPGHATTRNEITVRTKVK
jgi:hypothetical protein